MHAGQLPRTGRGWIVPILLLVFLTVVLAHKYWHSASGTKLLLFLVIAWITTAIHFVRWVRQRNR